VTALPAALPVVIATGNRWTGAPTPVRTWTPSTDVATSRTVPEISTACAKHGEQAERPSPPPSRCGNELLSHYSPFFAEARRPFTAIFQLSSASNQPHTRNDCPKPLHLHCILALEADRHSRSPRTIGFVRESSSIPLVWRQICARKSKIAKRTQSQKRPVPRRFVFSSGLLGQPPRSAPVQPFPGQYTRSRKFCVHPLTT
jgi:hypothetical protein